MLGGTSAAIVEAPAISPATKAGLFAFAKLEKLADVSLITDQWNIVEPAP